MNTNQLYLLLKNKSILITGGTGFFGKNLCDYLVNLNNTSDLNLKIFAMARKIVEQAGVHFIQQDLLDEIKFSEPVDYIIHAATPVVNDKSTSEELLKIIINGTQNIIRYAQKNNVKKILLISSGAVYGTQPDNLENIDEDYFEKVMSFDEKNPYATGKRISEHLIASMLKNSTVEYSIARAFAFSGKYLALDQHFAIGNFVRDVCDTKIINVKGDGSAIRTYMDSADLAPWCLTLLLSGKNAEAYNLGSEECISIKDLAYKIARKVEGAQVNIQSANTQTIKKNRYVPSTKKARSELGLKLTTTLDESIDKMIKYYKEHK